MQELAGDDGDGRNWRGIVISILVILLIFGLVLIAIVIVSPSLFTHTSAVQFLR